MRFRVLCLLVVICIILTGVVGVVPVSAGPTEVELYYDDGGFETSGFWDAGMQISNKFSLPAGWTGAKILKARYRIEWFITMPAPFKALIYSSDGTTELGSLIVAPTTTGWFDVDLTGLNIRVSGDFYVAMEYLAGSAPEMGADFTSPNWMSYWRASSGVAWILETVACDYGIRVVVEQVVPPIPEFSLTIPVVTSLAATMYLIIRQRLGKRKE